MLDLMAGGEHPGMARGGPFQPREGSLIVGAEAPRWQCVHDRWRDGQPEASDELAVQLDRLAHGELLRRRDEADERPRRIAEELVDASEHLRNRSDPRERPEGPRGGEERQGVAGCRGVDEHDVVGAPSEVTLLHPAEQPVQHQELRQPRRGRGEDLERRALQQPSREHAEAEDAVHEVGERVVGLERRRLEARRHEPRGRFQPIEPEQRPEAAVCHLDREHASARTREGARERGRHGALSDATLSRDDDQALGGERKPGRHGRVIAAGRANCQFASRAI